VAPAAGALPFAYPLLATFLLTGGRESEILGLEVGDVSFARQTVTFRVNQHRRLKTRGSERSSRSGRSSPRSCNPTWTNG
jgi:integrase